MQVIREILSYEFLTPEAEISHAFIHTQVKASPRLAFGVWRLTFGVRR
jgi:hypothetical protein